ncbi:phosphoglycerate mutase-like protein [Pseudovirgaria hyperparasitica]|uniref:Phosphoglycerate mutase-like protein n=1 Tax=Pseudovirgaria hyperparasitica TaxID=470096 RepID=A0A6A6WHE9_9PEZI|nr:phosphoglycerate mutase-like protein [Pseudovirgaria hyperparasitica]KAF2760571.1 phosphoglycerate mutase-like protein [Pseudovirgaria hyperparasitica]
MRLFLIRHGETVDNIAQLYAGSRDSELTNHGVSQATRLGQHFRSTGVKFTHIFSSQLQRAYKTADIVRQAQSGPLVLQSPLIAEQDFGSSEGKSWASRASIDPDMNDQPVIPSESRESMESRVDQFLDSHLEPIIAPTDSTEQIIAVVSHGIILGVLWRRILRRLPPQSVTLSPEIAATNAMIVLEHLGRWGNTCYLELTLTSKSATGAGIVAMTTSGTLAATLQPIPRDMQPGNNTASLVSHFGEFTTTISRVNARDHLKSLKRTGGGVGSAKYDSSQPGIETFFKKPRKT